MERPSSAQEAPRVFPIPAPIEFPFPPQSDSLPPASSSNKPGSCTNAIVKSQTDPQPQSLPPATPSLKRIISISRPKVLRPSHSERPGDTGRESSFGLKRARTTFRPTSLTEAAGDHRSDSESSEEGDDHKLLSPPSHLSGRSPAGGDHKPLKRNPATSHTKKKHRGSHDNYGRFAIGNDNYQTRGKVSRKDGRLNISVNEMAKRGYLANALGTALKRHLRTPDQKDRHEQSGQTPISPSDEEKPKRPDFHGRVSTLGYQSYVTDLKKVPRLNIVIMVIGSRGDIQPFLKIGKLLKEDYGHRIRIATHPAFKKFVEHDIGLDFFSVGGDPAELMAFMVKNPGLIPSASTVRAGEVGRRRDAMFEMFQGFWRACINTTDDEHNASNRKMMGDRDPFVADAIIANPPSFAHVHCAERLGVPLHLMFTFPYSPTQQFPHPLANIKRSNVDSNYTNFMSYPLVEMMTWQGLGDLVNKFRVKTLGLEPVSTLWAPGQLYRQKVPYTYMWSPGLIPKPSDWGPEIDVTGFVFLELASSFTPPDSLAAFLEAGEPPIYIGFGSIVVDDPDKFTSLIFEAVKRAGVRALVSKGWGGLGDEGSTPNNVYMLENTPHDWLFPRVSAVVHHGGAGTTAIGLKCGKPTLIVPFFGDQSFWGSMVGKAGAGAQEPIPYKRLTSDALVEGIRQCLKPEVKDAAVVIAKSIANEGDGAKNAVESFQRHLPLWGEHSLRCSLLPNRVAVWTLKQSNLRLSALAGALLVQEKRVKWHELKLLRIYGWDDFAGPGEPITGSGAAIVTSLGSAAKGVGSVPVKWARTIKKKEDRRKSQGTTNVSVRNTSERAAMGADGAAKPSAMSDDKDDLDPASRIASASQDDLLRNLAEDTSTGLAKTGEALAKAPMDLSLAIAQGFHNAPRLYGDSTVRTAPRVTGLRSGLRAAGTEFALGIYDGFTGLVLQPIQGAKETGVKGAIQGVGKGVGGFVLKDFAALFAGSYALKGVHKHVVKHRQPTAFIRHARAEQGEEEVRALSEEETQNVRAQVEAAWKIVQEIRKEDEVLKKEGVKGRVRVAKEKREKEGKDYANVKEARQELKEKQKERRKRENIAIAGNSWGRKRKSIFRLRAQEERRASSDKRKMALNEDTKRSEAKHSNGDVLDLNGGKEGKQKAVDEQHEREKELVNGHGNGNGNGNAIVA